MSKKNRFAEAFKENFNVAGLAGAAAVSAALLNPLPLLVGIVAEAAYLIFVPDSKWYESRLSRRFDSEVAARRQALKAEIFAVIPERLQKRFLRLENLRSQIQAQPSMENENWFQEVVRKLDYLLEKFLLFARKETEFRSYLASVLDDGNTPRQGGQGQQAQTMPRRNPLDDLVQAFLVPERPGRRRNKITLPFDLDLDDVPAPRGRTNTSDPASMVRTIQTRYDAEIARIKGQVEAEEDLNTRAVLQKRVDVLEQRREYVGKIGKILTNLGHQMELLEDSFGLINDQMRARSPEQVLADIEGVVYQTDSMTKLLEELAPYDVETQY